MSKITNEEDKWVCTAVDRGATEHAVNKLRKFEEVTKIDEMHLTVSDGSRTLATHEGEVLVMVREQPFVLRDVYYVPSLHLNVLSYARLDGGETSHHHR